MNTPDPFDNMLSDSLQNASAKLDDETFRAKLAARIEAQQRRMKLLRMLPGAMGLLGALFVVLVSPLKLDARNYASAFAPFWEGVEPLFSWIMKTPLTAQNLLAGWMIAAIAVAAFCTWLVRREPATFRL